MIMDVSASFLTLGVGYGGEALLFRLMGHYHVDGETEAQTWV